MTTIIEIDDPLDERGCTPAFQLRDASVTGQGLQPGIAGLAWHQLLALAYGSRFAALLTRNPLVQ